MAVLQNIADFVIRHIPILLPIATILLGLIAFVIRYIEGIKGA